MIVLRPLIGASGSRGVGDSGIVHVARHVLTCSSEATSRCLEIENSLYLQLWGLNTLVDPWDLSL